LSVLPENQESFSIMTNERYSGRGSKQANTLGGRLYKKLYVHPARFYGDLQKEGIPNWHKRVKEYIASFPQNSRLLDLGSGPRRISKNILTFDIAHHNNLDAVGDAHHLPFRPASFDGIILQMVLEHVQHPEAVLTESHRVLKGGGKVYCEIPFLYPVHDQQDFHRWTLSGLQSLCADIGFRPIDTGVVMGPFSAITVLIRRTLSLYPKSLWGEALVDLLMGWLLWPLKHLDAWLPPATDSYVVAGGVYLIAQKHWERCQHYTISP
jgi:SAM-dependent methyltransferase